MRTDHLQFEPLTVISYNLFYYYYYYYHYHYYD